MKEGTRFWLIVAAAVFFGVLRLVDGRREGVREGR